ncbi:pentraxin-related protein PTX3-like [Coregonus clupeaformis]|uniref:pentraxin-related protein PTX3-like n=1 Tax=Coregonus clupeaformis TaxID=59861 RepID=UPI001BE0F7FF|nr:pentraxin-related protein PTX3-like [Coregonus clupeaformis]
MFLWRLPQAVCLVSVCVSLTLGYEDDIEVNYGDSYFNEITEGEPLEPTATLAPGPCNATDITKWDKLFSLLENSQMRETMLLQYSDDIIKVELGSLRGEMLRFVAQYGEACGIAVETAGRRMSMQMEARLRETMGHLRQDRSIAASDSAGNSHQEKLLQQLLTAARTQDIRLIKLENSCLSNPEAKGENLQQEVASAEMLDAVVTELVKTRAVLELVFKSAQQRHLPAGCETALLFPMRSRRIFSSVTPDLPLSLSFFTVCLWAKPVSISNRTVLFSYGTKRNPYEIQLLLSGTRALFTVGGEAHLVEGRGVVKGGGVWTHLCGSWSSEQGIASLWADGHRVAFTPGVAEGRMLPDGGSLQLGQEKNGGGVSGGSGGSGSQLPGFEGGFDAKLAFAGKMTGVNMWDRVLAEDEISQLALQDGKGCEQRGNVVGWGLTEIVPHGGAQFIN